MERIPGVPLHFVIHKSYFYTSPHMSHNSDEFAEKQQYVRSASQTNYLFFRTTTPTITNVDLIFQIV